MNAGIDWIADGEGAVTGARTRLRGMELLNVSLLNRGTAFSQQGRDELGLNGLLPPQIVTREEQMARLYRAYSTQPDDLRKHFFLRELQDRNEILYYSLLEAHVAEMMPVIYTPTVALGCSEFSRHYTKPRGLFFSWPQRHRMREMLSSRPYRDVDIIVVTDGERVLGIGDQGVGGMGICIGKLALYSLLGGIHPARTLPIVLDVGTDNEALRKDPFYLGWRHERIGTEDYFAFLDEFVSAIRVTMPRVLLQWEDFARRHAQPILDRYREQLCTFNDDIQGTAAVVLGAIHSALRASGGRLGEQRIVIAGAGGAGTGIATALLQAMGKEGLSEAQGKSRLFLQDVDGLVRAEHATDGTLTPAQQRFAKAAEALSAWPLPAAAPRSWSLLETVRHAQPTILIGVSTRRGLFSKEVIEEMSRHTARPIVFPLSNPTSCAEGTPAEILEWSEGRALVATGAPFAPVLYGNRSIPIAQVNNFYIFPGLGLGVAAVGASRVTDRMLLAAAEALGEWGSSSEGPSLLPPVEGMQEAAIPIAVAVAQAAREEGVAEEIAERSSEPLGRAELERRVRHRLWRPGYPALEVSR